MALTALQLCSQVALAAPDLHVRMVKTDGVLLHRFSPLEKAGLGDVAFVTQAKYAALLHSTQASAVVIKPDDWQSNQALLLANTACLVMMVCDNPYAFFAFASQALLASNAPKRSHFIHSTACIDPSVRLGQGVHIGAYSVVEANAVIGDECVIGNHVSIANDCRVGNNTVLHSHVVLYHGVHLGNDCMVHSGTVIGSDGFGFAPYQQRWVKIPQTGTVLIGDSVEIGSNCSIDRGALGDTCIGRGTKLDNLIQIAHNVHIGEDCAFAANIAIAGSAVLGNRIQIGGNAGVLGHLSVCDDVVISSSTLVTKSITKPGFYTGVYPIQDNAEWEKNAVSLKKLNTLRLQVRALEQSTHTPKVGAAPQA